MLGSEQGVATRAEPVPPRPPLRALRGAPKHSLRTLRNDSTISRSVWVEQFVRRWSVAACKVHAR
eukprot:4646461-Alexandrium_andersonii.AAC.1